LPLLIGARSGLAESNSWPVYSGISREDSSWDVAGFFYKNRDIFKEIIDIIFGECDIFGDK
jgi:hypothetical protein